MSSTETNCNFPHFWQKCFVTTLVASARFLFAAQLVDSVFEWRDVE